jgi:hypothetical protein
LNMALSLDDLPMLAAVTDSVGVVEEQFRAGIKQDPAQILDLGLHEILILVADRRGHVDMASLRPRQCRF